MKSSTFKFLTQFFIAVLILLITNKVISQDRSDFWKNVRFGGGIGFGFSTGYFSGTLAPSAIYEVNEKIGIGLGLQGSYVSQKNVFNSFIYGASIITLFNPLNQIQLSAELEQLHININVDPNNIFDQNDRFWTTALFMGIGYRIQNVTVGMRYNILHSNQRAVYDTAFMPFVRVFF